jgi:hypothetical protein
MSTFLRAFGPPVVLTAPLTIGLIISGTPGPFTLNSTDSAYPVIGTGATPTNPIKYRYTDFLVEVWRKLRQWIFDAGVAEGLTPVGTVDDVELSLDVIYPNDCNALFVNEVRINLRIPDTGLGFVGTSITAISIANAAPATAWGHYLGLHQETTVNQAWTSSLGVWRKDGVFQPRYISVLLRSEQDSGEYEERQDYRTTVLGSGAVVPYNYGFAEVRRDLKIVSLHPYELAPQFHIGSFHSFDVTRRRVRFANPVVSGANSSGVFGMGSSKLSFQADRISVGQYIRVAEQWVSRVQSITIPAPPALIEVLLWDIVPTNITPSAGSPIYRASEMHAIVLESLRLGGLFVYDVTDDTGEWRSSGPLYQMRGGGKLLLQFDRQTPQASDRYNFPLNLVRSGAPGLVEVA